MSKNNSESLKMSNLIKKDVKKEYQSINMFHLEIDLVDLYAIKKSSNRKKMIKKVTNIEFLKLMNNINSINDSWFCNIASMNIRD